MKLAEHNAKYQVKRLPQESVHSNTFGYGEFSQYDSNCSQCYLGHSHTWEEHDRNIDKRQNTLGKILFDNGQDIEEIKGDEY